jgi:hypothetical protein
MAAKNIFDHLKGVTLRKTKWESLSEEDKKSWNNYMISRFFSMEMELTDVINEFQKYSNGILSSEDYYKLLSDALPKHSFFLKYVKAKNRVDIDAELITLFCNHFQLGKNEVFEYIRFLKRENPIELTNILKKYGTKEDVIKDFEKKLKTIK